MKSKSDVTAAGVQLLKSLKTSILCFFFPLPVINSGGDTPASASYIRESHSYDRNNTNYIFFCPTKTQAHILSWKHKQLHWFDLNESTLSCSVAQTISQCKHNKYRQLDGSCLLISDIPFSTFR